MRKDFYIFRHGQTDYNLERRWQGCGVDTELNAGGIEQAYCLAERLQPLGLEIIFSSPLKRALKTAQIVGEALNIPVEICSGIREGCFGEAEGMLKSEVGQRWPEIFSEWYSPANDLNVGFPGGETKLQMQNRMLAAMDELARRPQKIIGVATHGSSIRYLLMYYGRQPSLMPNTALFHLVWEDGNWRLEKDPETENPSAVK